MDTEQTGSEGLQALPLSRELLTAGRLDSVNRAEFEAAEAMLGVIDALLKNQPNAQKPAKSKRKRASRK